jgi:hypothetical protein
MAARKSKGAKRSTRRAPSTAVERYCGARTRRGTACKRPAGWGTGHLGTGVCVRHGGRTRNHETKGARDLATAFVVGQLGAQVPIDPLDAAVKAVELAHGSVEYWRTLILEAIEKGENPSDVHTAGYRDALQDLSRMTEAANRAGVADRMAALTERAVDQVTLAFEQAAMAMKLDAATRAIGVKVFAEVLAKHEGDTPPLLNP